MHMQCLMGSQWLWKKFPMLHNTARRGIAGTWAVYSCMHALMLKVCDAAALAAR